MRHRTLTALVAVFVLCGGPLYAFADGELVTTVSVVEKASVTTANYPLTLSLVFKQGDVASNVTARVGAQTLPTQTDVKIRWGDTSVKHALVSFVIPQVPADQTVTVEILNGGTNYNADYVDKTELLATDFEASMSLNVGGTPYTASARQLLGGIASPEYWTQGEICSEFLIRDFSVNIENQLNVQYYVRTYPGWSGFRVATVVENCWTEYRGNLTYDFDLELGNSSPVSVFAKTGFTHTYNARWHKVFWQGNEPPEIEIQYDLDYMTSTGILPNYDTSLVVPESTISGAYSGWQSSGHDIMDNGIIMTYFPTTGDHAEIGLYPLWDTRYLFSMDNRMREITLNCGDLSGSIPIHLRESDASRPSYTHVINIDDRPTVWSGWWDYTYQDPEDKLPAPIGETSSEWGVDKAHQGSLACVSYLVTGDFYYLEEMYFWAGWNLSDSNHDYRFDSLGIFRDQTRGDAWAIRNVADPANLAPDGHSFDKSYFTSKTSNNINWWYDYYVVNGDYPSIHYWQDQDVISRPDGSLDPTCTHYTSPWMDDFVLVVLGHMKETGWATTALMEWMGESIINRFSHPDYNWYRGAPYHIPVKYDAGGGTSARYETWLDVNNAFVDDVGPSDFPNPDFPSSYSYIARCAMTFVTHMPNGQATWNWLDGALYGKDGLNEDPRWAFLPRTAPPPDTTPPAAVTDLAAGNPTSSSIDLSWTAPGDDGTTGTASSYDIRYSTSTIDEGSFAGATQVASEPTPQLAGTPQGMTVPGLSASTTYYFAMKTSDEVPNVSALSNVASGATTAVTLPSVQFDLTSSSGAESVTPVNLSVSLSQSSSQTVTVDFAVTGGTAVNPDDYTIAASPLTFAPGVTQQNIVITVVDDGAAESDETIQVTLSNPTNATLGANTVHTYTIQDNDAQPGDGTGLTGEYYDNIDFTAFVLSRVDATVNFNWGTDSPDPSMGVDTFSIQWVGQVKPLYSETYTFYTNTDDGVRLWVDGQLIVDHWVDQGPTEWSGTIALSAGVKYDIEMEYYENGGGAVAELRWSSASQAKEIIPQTQLYPAAAMPTVQFDLTASSGAESVTPASLSVSLSAAYAQTVTVDYAVTGGTATGGGVDYALAAGTLTFDPNDVSETIAITIVDDGDQESDETVEVTLSNPTNAALGANTVHTYTILDNDAGLPSVEFDLTASAGDESVTPASLSVSLSQSSAQTVTVDYAVTGGTATQDVDYTMPPAGGSDVVALKRDAGLTAGGDLSPEFVSLGSGDVVLTTVMDAMLSEAANSRYMNYGASVTSSGGNGQKMALWVDLSAYAGATINKAELRLHVLQGNTGMSWAGIKSHDWAEGNKDADYPGNPPSAEGVCWAHPRGLYTDPSGALGWGAASDQYMDITGDGADLYGFTSFVSMPGGVAYVVADVTSIVGDWVSAAKSDYGLYIDLGNHSPELSEAGTAAQPVLFLDYDLAGGQVVFEPGQTSKTIDITIVDDGDVEGNETIEVTLSNPSNASLGANTVHTYTINDNDGAPTPTVQFDLTSSSGDESVTPANLAVSLSASSVDTVTVDYTVTGGSATGGGVDYTLAAGTLTFDPYDTSETIDITIVDDGLVESAET
ncbi:MAG TPA: Calx-beta domain-containing protein, partial [Phycisphaerae bacterium]|nr:Calx-beta domain-containing protein [Phycisphaerae bacterium]